MTRQETNKKENAHLTEVNNPTQTLEQKEMQLLKETTEAEVKKYLSENNISSSQLYKLDIRNTDIAAFKIAVHRRRYLWENVSS